MAVQHILVCDREGCSHFFGPMDDKNDLLRAASKNGWKLFAKAKGGFFCPSCSGGNPNPPPTNDDQDDQEDDDENPFATDDLPWT